MNPLVRQPGQLFGLDYAVNRWYSSTLGRFATTDAYSGSAKPGNPISLNRYAYVGGDPINQMDPSGQDAQSPCDYGDDQGVCWSGDFNFGFGLGTDPIAGVGDGLVTGIVAGFLNSICQGGGPVYGLLNNAAASGFLGCPNGPPETVAPASPECPLVAVIGDYNVASGVTALFAPDLASKIDAAFNILNQEGIVPTITSGFRTAASQQGVQGSPNGAAPVGRSYHQIGEAIDLNSHVSASTFQEIFAALTHVGLTWGGTFRHKDPVHYQNASAGTFPNPAQVAACAREHP